MLLLICISINGVKRVLNGVRSVITNDKLPLSMRDNLESQILFFEALHLEFPY
jgi:hypothetical protein